MFKTAVQEERTGTPWGFLGGLMSFVVLLVTGYFLTVG